MYMKYENQKPFIPVLRNLREDYLVTGKISYKEFSVICLLYFLTNPMNGQASVSYSQLKEETKIKKDYLRKILQNLLFHKLIWFKSHKGRGGSFPVWIDGFNKSRGGPNNIIEIQKRELSQYLLPSKEEPFSQVDSEVGDSFHSSKNTETPEKTSQIHQNENQTFTTAHNKNENNNKNDYLLEKNEKGLQILREKMEEIKKQKTNLTNNMTM